MGAHDFPCVDQLQATPEILRGLIAGIDEEDARWKPAPDRFSIAEVLAQHCRRRSAVERRRRGTIVERQHLETPVAAPTAPRGRLLI